MGKLKKNSVSNMKENLDMEDVKQVPI